MNVKSILKTNFLFWNQNKTETAQKTSFTELVLTLKIN